MHLFERARSLRTREWTLLLACAFVLVALAVYGRSALRSGFQTLDDGVLIVENPIVHEISRWSVRAAFTTYDPELYIPLTLVVYQLLHAIDGLNPAVFHAASVSLHAVNALLVVAFLSALLKRRWLAATGGLLFLVHPLHTEAVMWAAGMKDLLPTTFFLASLLFYLRYRETRRSFSYALSLECFVLALLAKVVSASLPVVLILLDLREGRRWDRKAVLEKIPFLVLAVIFLIIGAMGKQSVFTPATLWQTVLLVPKSIVFYVAAFIAPLRLSVLYHQPETLSLASWDVLLPSAVIVAIVFLVSFSRSRQAAFAAGFFLVTLAPTFLNAAKGGTMYFASDRYAYIPSIGLIFLFCLAVRASGRLFPRLRLRALGPAFIASVLCLFASLASVQARVWDDSATLFTHALRLSPGAAFAWNNRGVERWRQGDIEGAVLDFQAAIDADPGYVGAHSNLAILFMGLGRFDLALDEFAVALRLDPFDAETHLALASLFKKMGREQDARDAAANAHALNPRLVESRALNRMQDRGVPRDVFR